MCLVKNSNPYYEAGLLPSSECWCVLDAFSIKGDLTQVDFDSLVTFNRSHDTQWKAFFKYWQQALRLMSTTKEVTHFIALRK